MTDSETNTGPAPAPEPPRKRRRWTLFLPLVLLAILAAGWSVYWFIAAEAAERLADAWFAREAQRGRTYACEQRNVSGYPFRIEFECTSPSLIAGPEGNKLRYTADRFLGVAQIYNLRHFIAEITGPVQIAENSRPNEPMLRADWSLAQVSAIISRNELEQLSVALDEVEAWIADEEGLDEAARPLITAKRVETHSRQVPGGTPSARDYDIAIKLRDAELRPDANALASPITRLPEFDLAATVRGLPQGLTDNIPANLRAWQANGGQLELGGLRADTGMALGTATGNISLNDEGRLNGQLTLTVAGVEGLAGGEAQGDTAMVLGALGMIGKSVTIDGRQAVQIPVRIDNGEIGAGPLQLLKLPPLF